MSPLLLLLGALAASGCAGRRTAPARFTPAPPASPASTQGLKPAANRKVIVTPETGLHGKVISVRLTAKYVVLNFPPGHMPALEQRLGVYRKGLKVGEVSVCGPQIDDDIVADLAAGEAQPGDEVLER